MARALQTEPSVEEKRMEAILRVLQVALAGLVLVALTPSVIHGFLCLRSGVCPAGAARSE